MNEQTKETAAAETRQPAKKETRAALQNLGPEKIHLWAKRELSADKSTKPYGWIPAEALNEKSPEEYARKVVSAREQKK